jgi:hypothetical protein
MKINNKSTFENFLSCSENQIVFVPSNQASEAQWHVYDCVTQTFFSYPSLLGTFANNAYRGGVYDPVNNQIVFVPYAQASQSEWHLYDCSTKTIFSYSSPSGLSSGAYYGGVYDPVNNQIVFVPATQASSLEWHVYDCSTQTVLSYPSPSGVFSAGAAYTGGVYDPVNKQIVFVPHAQATQAEWHVYDCGTQTVLSYPSPSSLFSAGAAYAGGVYDPLNNQIVFVPRNQGPEAEWHVYDCLTKTVVFYSRPSGTFALGSYIGGVYNPLNNQIVFVPYHQSSQAKWHFYDCETKSFLAYSSPPGAVTGAYFGGVYDPFNNQIVFIPFYQASSDQFHVFQNFGLSQISSEVAAHYLFNKF